MLDPNILPAVRLMVAGIAGLAVIFFIVTLVRFYVEAKRAERIRSRRI